MRRAANLGHTQAAFNVAVMLDSGRGAPRDVAQAALWYARAAAGGDHRAAFNLGQLYESGEGVPANADLARAWYIAADLPAARERIGETKSAPGRPSLVQAPAPLFPLKNSSLEPGLQQVDIVWTAPLEPEAVRFFVELRVLDAQASHEAWSGFVDVSSVRLPLPPGGSELWHGGSARWREARRTMPWRAGRCLRSPRFKVGAPSPMPPQWRRRRDCVGAPRAQHFG